MLYGSRKNVVGGFLEMWSADMVLAVHGGAGSRNDWHLSWFGPPARRPSSKMPGSAS